MIQFHLQDILSTPHQIEFPARIRLTQEPVSGSLSIQAISSGQVRMVATRQVVEWNLHVECLMARQRMIRLMAG